MVVVGGLTRLTDSGLSMVQWHPATGFIPPISQEDWQEKFSQYKQSPEYRDINTDMSLDEFKEIFWLEFIHRFLGRITGLLFFIPLVIFALQRALPPALSIRLFAIFLLGGLQGVIGWYMVKSGLIHDPWVSPLRLALHLGMAFIIFALILRTLLDVKFPRSGLSFSAPIPPRLYYMTYIVIFIIFLQSILGALLAGLDGGLTYNSFPLMDGQLIPDGLLAQTPWYENFYENITLVQFNHRIVGILTVIVTIIYCLYGLDNSPGRLRTGYALLLLLILTQFTLGITTLLLHVPIPLALLHQFTALALFGTAVTLHHRLRNRPLHRGKKTYRNAKETFNL